MTDKTPSEQTGLHALDLLDEHERLPFERELRGNPRLRDELRETQDQLAAIALTAPRAAPPAGVWQGIEKKLNLGQPAAAVAPALPAPRVFRFHPAWAAVAALLALSTWLGVSNHRLSTRLTDLETAQSTSGGNSRLTPGTAPSNGSTGTKGPRHGSSDPSLPQQDTDGSPLPLAHRTMRSMNLPLAVQRELDRLRAAQQDQLTTPEGVADLRIMEMHPPGSEAQARRERASLVTKVADAIAAANAAPGSVSAGSNVPTPTPRPTPAPSPAVLRGQGSSPSSDIVIEQGGTINLSALNLHPDAQIVHKSFPADSDFARYGLSRLDADRVWDGNGGIWYRQADGQTYLGQKAPAGFQAPDPDDPGIVPDTALRPSPTTTPASPQTAEPYAFPVISRDGQGMIVTQNLPVPEAGYGYALWGQDASGGSPILLGFLPPEEGGNGVFGFDLPAGAPVPAGFRITKQILTEFATPGSTVLQGP